MRIEIRHKFPSLNEAIAAAKIHWALYSKMKSVNTSIVAEAARGTKPISIPVHLVLTFIEPSKGRKRDIDNVTFGTKFILDGLVEAGVLTDDSPRYILSIKTKVQYSDYHGVIIETE